MPYDGLQIISEITNPTKNKRVGPWKPNVWTERIRETILNKVAAGYDLPEIFENCAGEKISVSLPPLEEFYALLRHDPEFRKQYDEAIVQKLQTLSENMTHIIMNADPNQARMIQKHITWMLERRDRKYALYAPTTAGDTNIQINGDKVLAAVVPPKKIPEVVKPEEEIGNNE